MKFSRKKSINFKYFQKKLLKNTDRFKSKKKNVKKKIEFDENVFWKMWNWKIFWKKNRINDIFDFLRIDVIRKNKTNFCDVREIKLIFFTLFFSEITFDVFIFFCFEISDFEKKYELIDIILKKFKIDKKILSTWNLKKWF